MVLNTSLAIGPVMWDNFNCDSASWRENTLRFTRTLSDHGLGQLVYDLLMEAFKADQAGMYLHSHSFLATLEDLLVQEGELESFIYTMGGKARPADPGDDAPLPIPGPSPGPKMTGGDGPCDNDELCEQCVAGFCVYSICQSCSG
ncbi:MAG TPA: hypothetical protein PLK04_10160 [Bacillota bacterium]|jgi:hypothetical protein|nr:hypothetical protein [Bacillota bacterium]HOB43649.1 hypothetical protein [Bacillota bacterium]HOK70519.1 hypothetical protein [Bacillota bacterium]HOL52352.1 hypothetical protein [Bacillota bacterium]HOO30630.1 hypothetical protein [Bacillota bacterium]